MAKTPSELGAELAALNEVVHAQSKEIDGLKASAAQSAADARTQERSRDREVADLRQELAVARHQLADHLKRVEEWDRRRWGMAGLVVAAILSFAANLIVAWVRK